ncbi:MAG: hypothetical protein Fues2KO_12880 [Fuerstiella sp.]
MLRAAASDGASDIGQGQECHLSPGSCASVMRFTFKNATDGGYTNAMQQTAACCGPTDTSSTKQLARRTAKRQFDFSQSHRTRPAIGKSSVR